MYFCVVRICTLSLLSRLSVYLMGAEVISLGYEGFNAGKLPELRR